MNVLPSYSIYLCLLKYIHVPTIHKSSLNSVVIPPLRGVPRSSSYCGLIMLYWAWQLKTILQSWGIHLLQLPLWASSSIHPGYCSPSYSNQCSGLVSISFLNLIPQGSRFLCVVPPSSPGHLHSFTLVVNNHLVIPIMLYCQSVSLSICQSVIL